MPRPSGCIARRIPSRRLLPRLFSHLRGQMPSLHARRPGIHSRHQAVHGRSLATAFQLPEIRENVEIRGGRSRSWAPAGRPVPTSWRGRLSAEDLRVEPRPGGMLVQAIPSYRLPREIVAREVRMVENMGVDILNTVVYRRSREVMPAYKRGDRGSDPRGRASAIVDRAGRRDRRGGQGTGVRCRPMRLGQFDGSGRRRPEEGGERLRDSGRPGAGGHRAALRPRDSATRSPGDPRRRLPRRRSGHRPDRRRSGSSPEATR